jgi:hypothetical protein
MESAHWIMLIPGFIGAGSLFVGVLTYMRSHLQIKKQRDETIIRHWQRVAVYKSIADGNARTGRPIDLSEIKRAYVAAALEFRDIDIPKDEIQDSALQRVLMSLIECRLIELMEDLKYRLVFVSSWEQKLKSLELMELTEQRLGERIVLKLNREAGKYDKGELWGEINNEEYSHESYLYVIQRMIAAQMLTVGTGGTLSLTNEVSKQVGSDGSSRGLPGLGPLKSER